MSFVSALDGVFFNADPSLQGSGQAMTVLNATTFSALLTASAFVDATNLDENGIYYPKQGVTPTAATFTSVAGTTYCQYLCRAKHAYTSVTVRVNITTAAVTPTIAEIEIWQGSIGTLGGNNTLTRVSAATTNNATFSPTGGNNTVIALSGVTAGMDLWVLLAASATTQPIFTATVPDTLSTGVAMSGGGRPSTLASPTAFAPVATAIPAMIGRFT